MSNLSLRRVDVASTEIPESSFQWKLDTHSGTETQTFYITADSYFFLFQIAYSTMSWSPSAQVTCRVYSPDGNHSFFTNNCSVSDLKFTDNNRCIKTPTLSYQLESTDPIKYNISFSNSDLVLNLSFEDMAGGFQINDGKRFFKEDESFGYVVNWFVPKAIVKGFMNLNGNNHDLQGSGTFLYACQSKPQSVGRWNFVNFSSKSDALFLYQFEIPKYSPDTGCITSIDSGSIGSLILDGKLESLMFKNYSIFHDSSLDSFSGYKIPKSITNIWSGTTLSGKSVSIKMDLSLSNLVSKLDILSELPYLIRVFLQTFITAPYLYQWIEPTVIYIEIDGKKFEISGTAFYENAIMIQLPTCETVLET